MIQQKKVVEALEPPSTTHTKEVQGDSTKRFATLKARAALAGVALHQLGDGGYLACRWNRTHELADLGAVEHWLGMVTGERA